MIQEYMIDKETIAVFSHLIPQRLANRIEGEELLAVGAYDNWEEEAVGVIVFRELNGWMELVWVKFSEAYADSEDAYQFLKHSLDRVRSVCILQGAFIDFADQEEEQQTKWIFDLMGFRKDIVSGHVYELTVSDVKDTKILHQAGTAHVRVLETLSDEMKKKVVKGIAADERTISLPRLVDWDVYDAKLSTIYIDQTEPKGLLLFEWQEDALVFACAWALEPKVLVLMLIHALAQAEQMLDGDTRILIPVLDEQTEALVKKLVPKAVCREMIKRSLSFAI